MRRTNNTPLPSPRAKDECFSRKQQGIRIRNTFLICSRPETGDMSKDPWWHKLPDLTLEHATTLEEIVEDETGQPIDDKLTDFMIVLCLSSALFLFRKAYGKEDDPE